MFRWEPWVRTYLVTQEMLQRLRFTVVPPSKKQPISVHLQFLAPALGGDVWADGVTIIRPPAAVFEGQIAKVLEWAELREERSAEILAQIENQHCFWGSIVPIHTDRMRHTRELLEVGVQLAVYAEMRFKHELACWRPTDYSAQIQPMITTPGHGSLPSGHCTQSYLIYEVFKALLNTMKPNDTGRASLNRQMGRIAARVSTNRVIAGVHFPVDNVAGRLLGSVLGEFFCYLSGGRDNKPFPDWHAGTFDGTKFPPDGDFDPRNQRFDNPPAFYKFQSTKDLPKPRPSVLTELWQKAIEECDLLEQPFKP